MQTSGQAARDRGIARAVEHAEKVSPTWAERAYEHLRLYALRHKTFTAEEVRAAAVGLVPEPPDARAWGGVFQRAARANMITRHGYEEARAANVHCCIVTRWASAHFWE